MPGWQELAAKLGIALIASLVVVGLLVLGVRWMLGMSAKNAAAQDDAQDSQDSLTRLQRGDQRETQFRSLSRAERSRRLLDAYYKRHPERMPRGNGSGPVRGG